MLSIIAREMYEVGEINYRLQYSKLISHINSYLRIRKFDFEEEKVLQEFIARGVLVKEYDNCEVYYRFRFNCFFQYFLMKNIDYDSDFRQYVMQEENFLKFSAELEYYTGLKRDEVEILETIVNRMKQEFSNIIQNISEFDFGLDTIFEVNSDNFTREIDKNLFMNQLMERNKPTEKELEEINDKILDSCKPETGIENKKETISDLDKLANLWILAAKVLKNTEEVQQDNLKAEAYRNILICSLSFVNIYKYLLSAYLKEGNIDDADNLAQLEALNRYLPVAHQIALYRFMGTKKLSGVIREEIETSLCSDNHSDLEKFMSVFLYADMKGKDYKKYIEILIRDSKRSYIKDATLTKLLMYYYFHSNSSQADEDYRGLMGNVIVSSKKIKNDWKGIYIEQLKKRKMERRNKSNDDHCLINV